MMMMMMVMMMMGSLEGWVDVDLETKGVKWMG
jgi:hypothetical protein